MLVMVSWIGLYTKLQKQNTRTDYNVDVSFLTIFVAEKY